MRLWLMHWRSIGSMLLALRSRPRLAAAARRACGAIAARRGCASGETRHAAGADTRDFEEVLFSRALQFVHTHGWSRDAVSAAAESVGVAPPAGAIVGDDAMDIIERFMTKGNQEVCRHLRALPAAGAMSTRDLLEVGLRRRLEWVAPYLSTWPQAMAIGALPQNAPRVAASLGAFADELWHIAGDRSISTDWYTKRAAVLSVYLATELFMLTDTSEGQADTWAFLARRMTDIEVLGRSASDLTALGVGVATGLASIMSAIPSMVPGLLRPSRPPTPSSPEQAAPRPADEASRSGESSL